MWLLGFWIRDWGSALLSCRFLQLLVHLFIHSPSKSSPPSPCTFILLLLEKVLTMHSFISKHPLTHTGWGMLHWSLLLNLPHWATVLFPSNFHPKPGFPVSRTVFFHLPPQSVACNGVQQVSALKNLLQRRRPTQVVKALMCTCRSRSSQCDLEAS